MFPPERAPNVACLHATIHTQTIHAPPSCSQRHGGNSRQTDLAKLASQQPFCNGLRALPRAFAFVCYLQATVRMFRRAVVGSSQVSHSALPIGPLVLIRIA